MTTISRSVLVLLFAAATAMSTGAAFGRGAAGGGPRGGGGFGGYGGHYQQLAPRNYEHTITPRQPIFGPSGSARMAPPSNARPIISPHPINPHPATVPHEFHGRDLGHLDAGQRNMWRQGRWHHGQYGGLYGWWWFVGGYWYWYEEPIFPYPDYISDQVEPDTGEEEPSDATPPDNLQGDVYYYCSDPSGYYPYVATCNQSWETVPATPSP